MKTGIDKNTKTETVVNRMYQEMAQHYDTAVIPARVRKPRDKSTVEGNVGNISQYILAALSHEQFLSLNELNAAIWEKLREFNNKPFQKKDGSRATMFEEEKLYLQRLPESAYELAEWKIATVQYNYHISVDKQNYSVPFTYIKRKVDVRLTKNIIEVFSDGERICSHVRLYGRIGQYSTAEEHMPPNHQKYIQWNGDRFRTWAAGIGANTSAYTDGVRNAGDRRSTEEIAEGSGNGSEQLAGVGIGRIYKEAVQQRDQDRNVIQYIPQVEVQQDPCEEAEQETEARRSRGISGKVRGNHRDKRREHNHTVSGRSDFYV